jgi:thiol-disulfide isomerase/thioredoxin
MSTEPTFDPQNSSIAQRPRSNALPITLFLATLAFIVVILPWLATQRVGVPKADLFEGPDAPEITAAGWINGEAPNKESLAGKVVLVQVWATWCGPCRRELPHLVELHQQFADRGVVFIGLTTQPQNKLSEIKSVLKAHQVTWLNGWGAIETVQELGTEYLPSVYVIGANGKLLWDSNRGGEIEVALDRALSLAVASSKKDAG